MDTNDRVVTVKVTGEVYEMIRRGCDEEGTSISEYLRACVIRDRFASGDAAAVRIVKNNIGKALAGVGKATMEIVDKAVDLVSITGKIGKAKPSPPDKAKGRGK